MKIFVFIRSAFRFILSYIFPEQPLAQSEPEIIQKIHHLRFNSHNPYLITGGHFSDLFVRNTGIFYNALLDPRILSTEEDWNNRQRICFKTVKRVLEVFCQEGKDVTTISPLWDKQYVTSQIYTRASDSLYAAVYGLKMLTDINTIPFGNQRWESLKMILIQIHFLQISLSR
jgi:hypothetical protein